MSPGSQMRRVGWAVVFVVCAVSYGLLAVRVNTVKSEVRLAERQIIEIKRENILLETEFATRANQQQLADWNRLEFGYQAPRFDQYLENERQLASLGVPRGLNAPNPIRMAMADDNASEAPIAKKIAEAQKNQFASDEQSVVTPEADSSPKNKGAEE